MYQCFSALFLVVCLWLLGAYLLTALECEWWVRQRGHAARTCSNSLQMETAIEH